MSEIYVACRPFTKNKEIIQIFQESGHSRYTCQNKLYNACFQHDIAYGDFRDLYRRTARYEVLPNKTFDIGRNPEI